MHVSFQISTHHVHRSHLHAAPASQLPTLSPTRSINQSNSPTDSNPIIIANLARHPPVRANQINPLERVFLEERVAAFSLAAFEEGLFDLCVRRDVGCDTPHCLPASVFAHAAVLGVDFAADEGALLERGISTCKALVWDWGGWAAGDGG